MSRREESRDQSYIKERLGVHQVVQAEFFDATDESIIASYASISFLAYIM